LRARYSISGIKMRIFVILSVALSVTATACSLAGGPAANSERHASELSVTSTRATTMLIDQLPPPYAAKPAQTSEAQTSEAQTNEEAHRRLSDWLSAYLKDEYRIVGSRFFQVDGQQFQWVALWKRLANDIEAPHEACLEFQDWNRPVYDQVVLWRMPGMPYSRIAVAALNDDSAASGPRVVGYFQLERIDAARNDAALAEEQRPCERRGLFG
jgi:hypothetical protein